MISINSRHKLIEKFTFLLTSSQMPSHDQKADRTPTKRPLLVRQKAVVLIPPGAPKKPRVAQKHRSRYNRNTVASIRDQLLTLKRQVKFLSDLIDDTASTLDPTVYTMNYYSAPAIYGSSDTVVVDGSEDDEDGSIDDEIDALLNETAPTRSSRLILSASYEKALDKEVDELLGIDHGDDCD